MILRKCSKLYLLTSRLKTVFILRTKTQLAIYPPLKLAYTSYESTKSVSKESERPPILIMHGLFGSRSNWNTLSKRIHQETDRKVITIDARNHGDSPHAQQMSYYDMTEDIALLLKDLEINKVILVGHSMGGGAVMYTALSYPELVEKLIVVDFCPTKVSPSIQILTKFFEIMRMVQLDGASTLSKARKLADEQLSITIKSNAIRQFLLTNLVESAPGKYKWRVNLPVLEENFATKIAVFPLEKDRKYNGPTLFIGGTKSDYILESDHPHILKIFPTAKFRYITGAGHWVHADKPAEFIDIVTTFVNKKHY